MPSLLDLTCPSCGTVESNHFFPCADTIDEQMPQCNCGQRMEIKWTRTEQRGLAWHPLDTVLVYENPATGEVCYPGRNDKGMPERYRKEGYQPRQLRSLREVEQFEREHSVRSEVAWFDKGTGRGFDTTNEERKWPDRKMPRNLLG